MSKHMIAAADNLIEKMRRWRAMMGTSMLPRTTQTRDLVTAIDRWETAYRIELDRPWTSERSAGESLPTPTSGEQK